MMGFFFFIPLPQTNKQMHLFVSEKEVDGGCACMWCGSPFGRLVQ